MGTNPEFDKATAEHILLGVMGVEREHLNYCTDDLVTLARELSYRLDIEVHMSDVDELWLAMNELTEAERSTKDHRDVDIDHWQDRVEFWVHEILAPRWDGYTTCTHQPRRRAA
ncbi:hypothetical protein [Arthrobacter sp. RCC_34]|uniref:hypothetical protein n=1 Tax=Arthrobacter sp. RCC_34 TaxID=3239230 RepID=UPI003523A20B